MTSEEYDFFPECTRSLLSLSRRWVHTIDWITLNLLCESFKRSMASAREEHKQKIYFISLFEIELLFFYEKNSLDFLEKAKSDVLLPLSASSSTELSQFSRQRISININYAYHNPSEKKGSEGNKAQNNSRREIANVNETVWIKTHNGSWDIYVSGRLDRFYAVAAR